MIGQVGDRLKLNGEFCTIMFIGMIPNWPNTISYGLNWDNKKRGKNDGILDGVQYFRATHPSSGSFMKESKLKKIMHPTHTFLSSLLFKYGDTLETVDDIYFGSTKIESYGFGELSRRNSNFSNLNQISLSDMCINNIGDVHEMSIIQQYLCKLEELDISYNLFNNFDIILILLTKLDNLKRLKIDRNLLKFTRKGLGYEFSSLIHLSMSRCNLMSKDLEYIFQWFPNLECLDISGNDLYDLDDISIPHSIKFLDLSSNFFKTIPLSLIFSNVINLQFSNNLVTSLPEFMFNKLEALDISYNCIKDWSVVDKINTNMPSLINLRINGNKLSCLENDLENFFQLIGRLKKINILNGTILQVAIRKEAELFFISQVNSKRINYDVSTPHWSYLLDKYGISSSPSVIQNISFFNDEIVSINLQYRNAVSNSLVILKSYSVRYLKTLIAREYSLDIFKFKIAYAISNTIQEFSQEFSPLKSFNINNNDTIVVIDI